MNFRPGACAGFWRDVLLAVLVTLATGSMMLLAYQMTERRAKPAPPPDDHSAFFVGRPHAFAGDATKEVEVFKDQDGSWVALVWEKGRCWQGKLSRRIR